MYHKFTDSDIRSYCKEKLEALEYWLRRAVDETLTSAYGDYFRYSDHNGTKIIKADIEKKSKARQKAEPGRYSRLIDALLLDEIIDVICNPELYRKHFKLFLAEAFPDGREEARTFLKRLVPIRNSLVHANTISARQSEKAACYTNDVIDSIKSFYHSKNMNNEYNVPLILKIIDSFGNVFNRNQMGGAHDGGIAMNSTQQTNSYLHVGDILTIEIEVDPSFSEEEYAIDWRSAKGFSNILSSGKKIGIKITEKEVGRSFDIQCHITTNKPWHRMHMGIDDFMILYYKVLPP
jgi:hypothetical protein